MRLSGGRAGAAVAYLAEVVLALAATVGELSLVGNSDGQAVGVCGQVEEDPMREGASGGVGVSRDKREAFGSGWRSAPRQRGGFIFSVAGELLWHGAVFEAVACQG